MVPSGIIALFKLLVLWCLRSKLTPKGCSSVNLSVCTQVLGFFLREIQIQIPQTRFPFQAASSLRDLRRTFAIEKTCCVRFELLPTEKFPHQFGDNSETDVPHF